MVHFRAEGRGERRCLAEDDSVHCDVRVMQGKEQDQRPVVV